MSYFLPNERIGWQRWLAILGGFVGVVIALGPSFANVSLATVYALVGGFAYAGSLMMNKVLSKTSDTVLGTLQAVGALAVGSGFALYSWTPPSPLDFVLLLLLGVIACLAHLFITRSVKLAPVSVLAPFQYTLLLWGILFGIIVFGDVPSREILIGSGIIVLAGLFLLYSERRPRGWVASADTVMKDFP
jgi:S-adenosylmethionine uptake transporter